MAKKPIFRASFSRSSTSSSRCEIKNNYVWKKSRIACMVIVHMKKKIKSSSRKKELHSQLFIYLYLYFFLHNGRKVSQPNIKAIKVHRSAWIYLCIVKLTKYLREEWNCKEDHTCICMLQLSIFRYIFSTTSTETPACPQMMLTENMQSRYKNVAQQAFHIFFSFFSLHCKSTKNISLCYEKSSLRISWPKKIKS